MFSGIYEFAEDLEDFGDSAEEASDGIPDAVDEALFQSAHEMRTTAERLAPEGEESESEKYGDRQKLKNSLEVFKTPNGWGYRTDAVHSRPIEFGAGPHYIPKEPGYLEFEWPDAPQEVREAFSDTFPTVRFEQVRHPGNDRQPYFRPAFDSHKDDVIDNISDNIDRVIDNSF